MNVSKEAQKAETKLKNLAKRTEAALKNTADKWSTKRRDYIGSLPIQVRGMLKAGAVITDDDITEAPEFQG